MEVQSFWPKLLVVVGLTLASVGAVAMLLSKYTSFRLGHLPLDISIERDGFSLYFPLGTCILLSVLFTLIGGLYNWMK